MSLCRGDVNACVTSQAFYFYEKMEAWSAAGNPIVETPPCTVNGAESAAARNLLAVSERQMQELLQKGCGPVAKSDRAVMKVPDFRALAYPKISGPDIGLEADVNNKYLGVSSIGGGDFQSPFVGGEKSERGIDQAAYGTPGAEFAVSSGIGALDCVSFAPSVGQPDGATLPLYQRVAMDLGASPSAAAETPAPLRATEAVSFPIARGLRAATKEKQKLYGASVKRGNCDLSATSVNFGAIPQCIWRSCAGVLYDLAHYNDISDRNLKTYGMSSRAEYVCTRDSRHVYLSMFALLVVVAVLAIFMLLCDKTPSYAQPRYWYGNKPIY